MRYACAIAQMPPGAQPPPQGAQANPMCPRLEAQLATIDRGGGGDPAKAEQIRRYQDAAARQQAELDRVTSQAKRMGCDSSGFFSLFNGQSAQCGPVNNQIQQMRGNLDQITTSLERLRSGGIGGADRDNQRRSVLTALAQNNCGPQYAAAARGRRQFPRQSVRQQQLAAAARRRSRAAVRHLPHRLRAHLRRLLFPGLLRHRAGALPRRREDLQGLCPAAEATLFTYRNPGEDMNQAVSINGQPYSSSAERVQDTAGVQPVLRLQGGRPDLVGCAEDHRRQGRGRTAGRHHRHRGERQEDVAAAQPPTAERAPRRRQERRSRPPRTAAAPTATDRAPRRADRAAIQRTAPDKPIRIGRSRRFIRAPTQMNRQPYPSNASAEARLGARHQRVVGLRQRLAGVAKAVGDRIAAVAAEILLA